MIHFVINENVVLERMLARKRDDDDEQVIRERLKVYRESAPELVKHYRKQGILHEVDADADKQSLYSTISSLLYPPSADHYVSTVFFQEARIEVAARDRPDARGRQARRRGAAAVPEHGQARRQNH